MTVELQIAATYDCDVLVIGSGVSGYCAAIQAGREGCETILLEKDEVLGGNSGPNLGVGITGADRYSNFAGETGLIQELQEDAAWVHAFTQLGPGTMRYSISRRNEAVVQEHLEKAGVRVLKRHYAKLPIMDGNRIVAVIVEDLAAFRTIKIDVRHVVIEASGDGEMGALAGADFDMGSEAQDEYGERSAPAERTKLVQGTSLVAIAQKTDHEVVFQPPAGTPPYWPRAWQSRISSFLHHHNRQYARDGLMFLYVTEAGGHMGTIREDGEIYEMLLKQLWAEWDHIKNGPHQEEARCWDLLWVSPKAGKRESRRFLGDYVLTQTDLEDGRRFDDDIAYGGHDLDDHQPFREGGNIFAHSIPPIYGIPFRTCYSRNIENLLLGGRLTSATHLAHSSTRIMRTGGAIGQAIGLAAAMCREYGCSPRTVYQQRVEELQRRLLRSDAAILARALDDPTDLARTAEVTATSELCFNDQEPGPLVPLIAPAGVILWDWPANLNSAELYLRNDSDTEQPLTLSVHRAKREPKWKSTDEYHTYGRNDLRDQSFRKLGEAAGLLPPRYEGWFTIEFPEPLALGGKDPASDDDRVLIALDQNEEVSWAAARRDCEIAEMVEHSHHSAEWKAVGAMATMRLEPAPSLSEARNVINGFHRRFSRAPTNMWISDPADRVPQDLILSWPDPQTFSHVQIVFDNLAPSQHENPWESGERVHEMCVKMYTLDVWQDGAWKEVGSETDNYHRVRAYSFKPVTADKLRLRVLKIHGEGRPARVYQVSVYSR